MNNIILVGLPRAGTTLTCHLINKLPDAVALNEPMQPSTFKGINSSQAVSKVKQFYIDQRKSLLENGTAVSKTHGGQVPDNPLRGMDSNTGTRTRIIDSSVLEVKKELPNDFTLVVKHNAFFAAILAELANSFSCFAVVRNPLSVLLSWNSVEFPVSNGYAPAAENFDKKLEKMLRSEDDKITRQIDLLSWYYNKIYKYVPESNVMKYEEIISSGGSALRKIVPSAVKLNEPLKSKNKNPVYDTSLKPMLAKRLLEISKGGYLHYYSKDSVKEMLEN